MNDCADASNEGALKAFAAIAREFCEWCEGESLGADANRSAARWLAQLHAAALTLPDVEPDNGNGLPDLPATTVATTRRNFAPYNGMYYRECFDPDPTLDDTPEMGDVGDDLLDIYKDIRAGLLVFDAGETNEALWHWAFLHRVHWGRHVVGALFALQCLPLE